MSMFPIRHVAAAIAALATCGAAAPVDGQPQPRAPAITCTNPASGATWQISIDYDRATVDANPARVSDAEISWRDAKDGWQLHARPSFRRSDGHRGVQHRRLLPARPLPAAAVKPVFADRSGPASSIPEAAIPASGRTIGGEARRVSEDLATPRVSIGYHSATGPRPRNEDFVGAVLGSRPPRGAAGRGGGHRRRHRQRQGRAGGGGDRGARVPRRVLGRAGDHGGAAGRGPHPRFAQRLDQRPGAAGRQPGRHGLHLHRAGAARPARACAACRRHAGLPAERRSPAAPHHRPCARRPGQVAGADPRARHRGGAAAGLHQPSGGAARPLPAVHRRGARLAGRRGDRRHPARALGARGYQPGAGRGGAGGRQHRQLHRPGAGRGGAADGALGRCRRRHHAAAADPGAAGRRHGRRVRAERPGVRRPLQPAVRRDRRGGWRHGGAEVPQAARSPRSPPTTPPSSARPGSARG